MQIHQLRLAFNAHKIDFRIYFLNAYKNPIDFYLSINGEKEFTNYHISYQLNYAT